MNFHKPLEAFKSNLDSVSKLINFDKEVQEIAINGVKSLHAKLVKELKITNPQLNGERTLQILYGIRDSPTLRERYALIFNQAVVLMVSYFGSALGDIFRITAASALAKDDERIVNVELKVRIGEILLLAESPEDQIGDLIILKDDISFQDMQSTHRAFKKYFDVQMETNDIVRNIIVAQACRHAIVHDGGKVNQRTMNQIRNSQPRTLKTTLSLGQEIRFSINEIESLSDDMRSYVSQLAAKVGLLPT